MVTVRTTIGETAKKLMTRQKDGRYKFNCDAYVDGEPCRGGFLLIRQAREITPGKKLGNNVRFWYHLRRALHEAGAESVDVPGGNYPIHYCDEIVIPNYTISGTRYFIIKSSEANKYFEMSTVDDAGQACADASATKEAETAVEADRKAHDPKCIAICIGDKLWCNGGEHFGGEFQKITLIAEDNTEFSVIYPSCKTDLIWPDRSNVAKILCTAPETGIQYLSGWSAGHLDPRKHIRIKKIYRQGLGRDAAYLMPNPELATEVRECYNWLGMFQNSDNDGVSPELIASAKKIILEAYDLNDVLQKKRLVYDRKTNEVSVELLYNWPFDAHNEVVEEFDWRTCQTEH